MTTTFYDLADWYGSLFNKFGRLMLPHMTYKHQSYLTELTTFLSRAEELTNNLTDKDTLYSISIYINNIKHLQTTFKNIIENHCTDKSISFKKTRRTSEYNKFIKENFKTIKMNNPEYDNSQVMKTIADMWKTQSRMYGGENDNDYNEIDEDMDNLDELTEDEDEDENVNEPIIYKQDEGSSTQTGGNSYHNLDEWKKQIKNFAL